ncbi:MAG: ABC transporter ATP-binding protein [Bacillota bacterium]|nr:ABC transporter ATP-binding protein [Bacillota bacterium]
MDSILKVSNLNYSVNNINIIKDINFNVLKGEFISIIGPNGAGKTTLIKCLADNLDYTGTVELKGKSIKKYSKKEKARIISVVPQEYTLPFNFKVIDIIKMGRNPYKDNKGKEEFKTNKNLIYKAMVQTNTYDLRNRFYNSLSGGEKQRVITARALAQDTDLIYLDEVTSSLDMHHELEIVELIYRLNREEEITVISIMHDLNIASRFSDRILFLNNGEVVEYDTPEKVFNVENLSKAYNMEMLIRENKLLNYKEIVPLRVNRDVNKKDKKIHIICGGGTGEYIIEKLFSEKYDLSCGIIHDGDSDVRVCESLNIECIKEKPFSEFSEKVINDYKNKIQNSDIVLVTDVPFGKHNITNLRILKEYKNKKIIILHNNNRDFIEGESDKIIEKLKTSRNVLYANNLKELFEYIKEID